MKGRFKDGNTWRSNFNGAAMLRGGRKVEHHAGCEANMCDGRPFCRTLDEHGWAILIEKPSKKQVKEHP